ncbi:hypothetical protein GM415_06170 [Pseudodesulfovibrio cashew]|uniref:Uncharacterized protein n=1 Tax=Pseudodesulfovibrio cashew TaxID=2678688 RepID=A0A6I6JEW6_9BACT|nr:hypothetical protein [Pseudodesulfovibrio cashew]QGY39719.1 hypothetical protein GM415_06170 [Pseudodesulfovibrio cashew]
MTISSTLTKAIYAGNGSTSGFAVPFMFLRDEDVEVILSDGESEAVLTISTDYQLAGAGDQSGGLCTLNVAPVEGETLVLRRNPALVQEVDYVENDAFPAATHEAALDKLTMICQALAERLDRTITFRVSSAVTGVELPEPESNQLLAWNGDASNLTNRDAAAMDAVLLPLAVEQGGTGGSDGTQAMVNLGMGETGRSVAVAGTSSEALAAMDAEPADTAILKADLADLLRAVYGEEPQEISGTSLTGLSVTRNHLLWTLTGDATFDDVDFPYDGTYVFHIYPAGHTVTFSSAYKLSASLEEQDPAAGEIRVAVEVFNGRKSLVGLQNMGA